MAKQNIPINGSLTFNGDIAGSVALEPQAVAGSLSIQLPNVAPLPNQLLTAVAVNGYQVTLGWSTHNATGDITSVTLTAPAQFTVSGSPITSGDGTIAIAWANATANQVLAGPATGPDAIPGFRALVAADLPSLSANNGDVMTWNGTAWTAAAPAGGGVWGSITGTLSNQTDLQNALNAKANLAGATFTGAIAGTSAGFKTLDVDATGTTPGVETVVIRGGDDTVTKYDLISTFSNATAVGTAQNVFEVTAWGNVYLSTVTGNDAVLTIFNNPQAVAPNLADDIAYLGQNSEVIIDKYGTIYIQPTADVNSTNPALTVNSDGTNGVANIGNITVDVNSNVDMGGGNLTLGGELALSGALKDHLNSAGTNGQILTSTGTQVAWGNVSPVFSPTITVNSNGVANMAEFYDNVGPSLVVTVDATGAVDMQSGLSLHHPPNQPTMTSYGAIRTAGITSSDQNNFTGVLTLAAPATTALKSFSPPLPIPISTPAPTIHISALDDSSALGAVWLTSQNDGVNWTSFTINAETADAVGTPANITNIAITTGVLTVTATNTFTVGTLVALAGLTTATFLNGQHVTITGATGGDFTADFAHADYTSAPDTGTATSGDHQFNYTIIYNS